MGFLTIQRRSFASLGKECSLALRARTQSFCRSNSITHAPKYKWSAARVPNPGFIGPGQMRDGPIFGCHRHPVFRFRENGVLAGDRVANDSKSVCCSDAESVEPVEILHPLDEGLFQSLSVPELPSEIGRRYLGVVLRLELQAVSLQLLPKPVVIGK